MLRKSNVNKTVQLFLVSLKKRKIITVKTVEILFFSLKVLKKKDKEAGTNFVLLCQSRNMVGQFKKTYLHNQSRFYIFSHLREFKNV